MTTTETAMATPATPIKIDIPRDEFTSPQSASPSDVSALIERLQRTPTELSAEDVAAKDARAKELAEIETSHRLLFAKRVSERVRENAARKLRFEAAAVQRAQSKMDSKALAKSAKQEELDAKRKAAAERSRALFEAVRETREARQNSRDHRIAALADLESKAAAAKTKRLATTVAKSAAAVKHAISVAQSKKAADVEAKEAAAAALVHKLEAAECRRQDLLNATVHGNAASAAAAGKRAARRLSHEQASIEERKARLASAMEKALGRKQSALDSIKAKASAELERVATTVEAVKAQSEVAASAQQHALVVKMQAAQVNHELAMKQATAAALAHAKAHGLHKKPAPEVILIPAHNRKPFAAPPAGLIERLLFRPRLLGATGPARQAVAAGRRATMRSLTAARASYFGTVRVGLAAGRRAASREITRSICELKERMGVARKAAARKATVATAQKATERVMAAKVRRSYLRLQTLHAAIGAETKRQDAALRRSLRLQTRAAPWAAVRANAVAAKRLAADEAAAAYGAACEAKQARAAVRLSLHLEGRVAAARRARKASGVCAEAALVVQQAIATVMVKYAASELPSTRAAKATRAAATSDAAAAKALARAAGRAAEGAAAASVDAAAAKAGLRGTPAKKVAEKAKETAAELVLPTVPPAVPTQAAVAAAVASLSSSSAVASAVPPSAVSRSASGSLVTSVASSVVDGEE